MFLNFLLFAALVSFSILASQFLFYALAFSKTQKALSASTFVELRKFLDKNIRLPLQAVYYASLTSTIALLIFALVASVTLLSYSAGFAFFALVCDIWIARKRNIPINKIINTWEADAIPRHWRLLRRKWFYYFQIRQALAIAGFLSLLAAAVFR